MKVIHFIGSIDRSAGGTATYLQLLAGELKALLNILVVTSNCVNPVEFTGVRIAYFDFRIRHWLRLRKEFREFLLQEKPDLVHVNGIWTPHNFLFQREAQDLNIKVVLSPHGMLEPYILSRNSYKKKIALLLYQKKAIANADFLHATATSELESIRNLGFKKPGEIIPNGLDISKVRNKEEIKIEGAYKNILFLSRIHPKKGIEVLIEAVAKLKEERIKVIIAGEGEKEYVDFLMNLSESKGVGHKIVFLGGVYGKDKWDLYQQAHLFVLPTYSENFGLVIIEALAAGVPVITTKGTPWEELETFRCGWWIDFGITALIDALYEAIHTSRMDLALMGQRGRKLVEQKYDSRIIAKKIFRLYEKVLIEEK